VRENLSGKKAIPKPFLLWHEELALSRERNPETGVHESDFSSDRTRLLDNLWAVQNEHGYIRRKDIEACSRALDISIVEVEGIISFYHFLTRKPAGKITIYLNKSIVSEHKGLENQRGIRIGHGGDDERRRSQWSVWPV